MRLPLPKVLQYDNGLTYRVYLPTGAYVMVKDSYEDYINVYVVPSTADEGLTEGLCGMYDGTGDNDLLYNGTIYAVADAKAYALNWRWVHIGLEKWLKYTCLSNFKGLLDYIKYQNLLKIEHNELQQFVSTLCISYIDMQSLHVRNPCN